MSRLCRRANLVFGVVAFSSQPASQSDPHESRFICLVRAAPTIAYYRPLQRDAIHSADDSGDSDDSDDSNDDDSRSGTEASSLKFNFTSRRLIFLTLSVCCHRRALSAG